MEIKVVCDCGQKYKFDVEPVGGRMPVSIACPSCGADGTHSANSIIAQNSAVQTAAVAPIVPPIAPISPPANAPVGGGLRISHSALVATSANVPPPLPSTPKTIAPVKPLSTAPKPRSEDFNMGLGIVGAFLGAVIGGGLVYAFYEWAHFRFPLSGIAIGALAGYGARWLGRGTHTTLGIIAGALALLSIVGVFYLIYGEFFLFGIISIVICVGVAYRAASE